MEEWKAPKWCEEAWKRTKFRNWSSCLPYHEVFDYDKLDSLREALIVVRNGGRPRLNSWPFAIPPLLGVRVGTYYPRGTIRLLTGSHRYMAVKAAGWTRIPVVLLNTEEKAVLMSNKKLWEADRDQPSFITDTRIIGRVMEKNEFHLVAKMLLEDQNGAK